MTEKVTPCPQAWHGGVHYNILEECKYNAGHRGSHRNEKGDLAWTGKLTPEETILAERLRRHLASAA